jgi:hypothetical protein
VGDEMLGIQVRQSFVLGDRKFGTRRAWRDILALGQSYGCIASSV